MYPRAIAGSLACSIAGLVVSSAALAAAPHTVLPGETLWSISAANDLTTRTVAVYNGLPETAQLLVGTTVYVPTVEEGAAALGSGAPAVAPPIISNPATGTGAMGTPEADASVTTIAPAPGMGHVPSPYGELHLLPAAADAWNAMRAAALSAYAIDIYPGGPVSAYRTYEQQSELYNAFRAGYGAPANPPGTSSHELGTAVDVESPEMRSVIGQIGSTYGWGRSTVQASGGTSTISAGEKDASTLRPPENRVDAGHHHLRPELRHRAVDASPMAVLARTSSDSVRCFPPTTGERSPSRGRGERPLRGGRPVAGDDP